MIKLFNSSTEKHQIAYSPQFIESLTLKMFPLLWSPIRNYHFVILKPVLIKPHNERPALTHTPKPHSDPNFAFLSLRH